MEYSFYQSTMKALILKITKKYAILMTSDGAFLRYRGLSSKYGIGDEVTIDVKKFLKFFNKKVKLFKK